MARKHKHEEEEKLERWLVSYADFITLLFAFFTVLYATSQSDKQKYQETAASIQKAFLSGGGIFPTKGAPFNVFPKREEQGAEVPATPKDNGKMNKSDDAALERIRENVQGIFERSTGLRMKAGEIEVVKSQQGFRIRITEEILFNPGSDKLKREHIPFLYELGKRLAHTGLVIQVEGHTDSREPASAGPSAQNGWQLSLSRAYHLVRFFIEGAGFPKNHISVSGYGDTQPLGDNDTPEGRRKNRRLEISVISGTPSLADLPW